MYWFLYGLMFWILLGVHVEVELLREMEIH
jgi:hypothetical protein